MRTFIFTTALLLLVLAAANRAFAQVAPPSNCTSSLWSHVYHPYRLIVYDSCFVVSGNIADAYTEADGDMHIRLTPDAEFDTMLNAKNKSDEYGNLVCEPVCDTTPTQADAIPACTGFTSTVWIPAIGEHVKVEGSYVFDSFHGWNEIHPVSRIWIPTASVENTPANTAQVNIFPNPADDEATIKLSEKASSTVFIAISDVSGKVIGRFQMYEMQQMNINTSLLSSGIYFYHVMQNDKEVQVGKMVVHHK
jgi:Secretion system C-terminal sorting domain